MLARIQRTEWEVVGSTELVGTELAAAAGVRARRERELGGTGRRAGACYGLVETF